MPGSARRQGFSGSAARGREAGGSGRPGRGGLWRAAAIAIAIGLSACVPWKDVREGTEIAARETRWVEVGATNRVEILARFGEPDYDFVDRRTIAYAWAGIAGFLCGYGCVVIPLNRALIVRFDAAGKVAAISFVEQPAPVPGYDALHRQRTGAATGWAAVLDEPGR